MSSSGLGGRNPRLRWCLGDDNGLCIFDYVSNLIIPSYFPPPKKKNCPPDGVLSRQYGQRESSSCDRVVHVSTEEGDDRVPNGTRGGALHDLHLDPTQANI